MLAFHGMSAKEVQHASMNEYQNIESKIQLYEIIFGEQFVSAGGKLTTKTFGDKLNLKPKEYVLDFGTGLGGSAFVLASIYQVKVLGVDNSKSMVSFANKYLANMTEDIQRNVEFKQFDVTKDDFPENSFDCIYTRESIAQIEDKESLLRKFNKWLKPNGKLLVNDYGLGNREVLSEDFKTYIKSKKYFMTSITGFESLLIKTGFNQVKALDLTADCINILKKDAEHLYKNKTTILNGITRIEYDNIVASWDYKLQFSVNGDQSWGLFLAVK